MFSIHPLLPLLLIASISLASHAKEAEDIEGFPQGPVMEVYKERVPRNWYDDRILWRYSEGKVVEVIFDNAYQWHGIFQWNDQNNLEEAQIYQYNQLHHKERYRYDQSNVTSVRSIIFHYGSSYGRIYGYPLLKYKHTGNLIEIVSIKPNGESSNPEIHLYDEHGNEASVVSGTNIIWRWDNLYDEQGRIVSRTTRDRFGDITLQVTTQYDDESRVTYYSIYNPSSASSVTYEYRYNSLGFVTEYTVNGVRYYYTYDELNRLIRVTNPKISDIEYRYGSNGELLEEIASRTGNPNETSTHDIYRYDPYGNMTERRVIKMKSGVVLSEEGKTTWTYTYSSPVSDWMLHEPDW